MADDKKQLQDQLQKCSELARQFYDESGILWKHFETAILSGHEADVTKVDIVEQIIKTSKIVQSISAEHKFVIDNLMLKGLRIHGPAFAKELKEILESMVNAKEDGVVECDCPDCKVERDKVVDFAKAAAEKAIRELKDKK